MYDPFDVGRKHFHFFGAVSKPALNDSAAEGSRLTVHHPVERCFGPGLIGATVALQHNGPDYRGTGRGPPINLDDHGLGRLLLRGSKARLIGEREQTKRNKAEKYPSHRGPFTTMKDETI